MIVSFSLIRRRADISSAAFQAHWLDPHGPLTARIPGTMRYVQNHVIDGPGTNARARELQIDGFAELSFSSPQSRAAAHASPEIRACNVDSQSFIGAVSRVITDDGGVAAPTGEGLFKQIMLTTRSGEVEASSPLQPLLGRLQITAVIAQRVVEQTAAPNSSVPHHGIEVDTLHEIWAPTEEAMMRNAATLEVEAPGLASFQVKTYDFL